jgi:ABC-type transport system substrate-binding protein
MKEQLADVGITLNIQQITDYVNSYLVPAPAAIGVYPGNAVGTAKLTAYTGDGIGNVCKWNDPAMTQIFNDLGTVSSSSDEAVDLWYQAEEKVTEEALSGFVVFRSQVAAYNSDRLGDVTAWPRGGGYVTPDPLVTYVKSGS